MANPLDLANQTAGLNQDHYEALQQFRQGFRNKLGPPQEGPEAQAWVRQSAEDWLKAGKEPTPEMTEKFPDLVKQYAK